MEQEKGRRERRNSKPIRRRNTRTELSPPTGTQTKGRNPAKLGSRPGSRSASTQLVANRLYRAAVGRDRRLLGQRGVQVARSRCFFVVLAVAVEVHTVLNYGELPKPLGHGARHTE